MTVYLKRFVGATAKAHRRSLEVANRGIEVDGKHGAQVGRWRNRQAVARLVGVVVTRHHFELAAQLHAVFQPAFAIGHKGYFGERHAMHYRDRQTTYARLILHIKDRAIYIHAVGVGAVEHKHFLAVGEGSVHEVDHGHIVGVVAESHVLDIYCNYVEFCHRLGAWHGRLAVVERRNGDSCLFIYSAFHLFTGIGVAAETVFGRENGGHVHALFKHHVEGVLVAHHAGVVAHYSHTLTLEEGDILGGALGTHFHGFIALGWAFLGTLLGTFSLRAATFAAIGACNTLCRDCKDHQCKKFHENPIVYHNS